MIKYILAFMAVAPLFIAAHPTNSSMVARDPEFNAKCKFLFTGKGCGDDFAKKSHDGIMYTPSRKDTKRPPGELYKPSPDIEGGKYVANVSRCYDMTTDPHAWDPEMNNYGQSIFSDKFPEDHVTGYYPNKLSMWMLDDSCQYDYNVIALFDAAGCRGTYVWYSLPQLEVDQGPSANTRWDGANWCAVPFSLTNKKQPRQFKVGSFQMWQFAPKLNVPFGSRLVGI